MTYSKEEKTMWLDDWKKSGKKAWRYAKENGLIPQTFCSWVKREEKSIPCFVEIPVYKKPKPEETRVIVVEKGDIKIHIPSGISGADLGTILVSLRAAV